MTELGFLLDLFLNHKLPKATKELVSSRIKEVEASYSAPRAIPAQTISGVPQAASTIAALERQAREVEPVIAIAQTGATQAAMASRQAAIAESFAGKVNKETGRPRKF